MWKTSVRRIPTRQRGKGLESRIRDGPEKQLIRFTITSNLFSTPTKILVYTCVNSIFHFLCYSSSKYDISKHRVCCHFCNSQRHSSPDKMTMEFICKKCKELSRHIQIQPTESSSPLCG